MPINYFEVKSKILAHRPAYEAQLARITALTIPEDFPLREFFTALREITLQAAEFGRLLDRDPEFKNISLEELKAMNTQYYATLEPVSGYATSLANPDFAVQLYGEGLGQFCSAVYSGFRATRYYLITENYLALDEQLRLFFALHDLAAAGNSDLAGWTAVYRDSRLTSSIFK